MSYRVPVLETFSWQKQVKGITDIPPVGPAKGDRYIIGSTPSGWTGTPAAGDIAWLDTGGWKYDKPTDGWLTYNTLTAELFLFANGKWDFMGAGQIRIDNTQFSVQIPNDVNMTLQEILVWMDANMGGPGPLGMPTDKTFADGLLEWTAATPVNDAVDDLNEVLKDLAPPQANTLASTTLANNRTLYSGKLPLGLSTEWYKDGKAAGDVISNVINVNSITLTSASQTDTFGAGDQGFLYAKKGGDTLSTVCKLNIAANFVEPAPGGTRLAVQDLNAWKSKETVAFPSTDSDTPDATNTATCAITKGDDKLVVTSVGKYNSFNMWQKMNANMQFSNLAEGFHQFQMSHEVRSTPRNTNITKVFYDNSAGSALAITSVAMTEETPVIKYLSGVRYYTTGSTFRVQGTILNIYQKIYRSDKVATVNLNAASPGAIDIAPDASPTFSDAKVITQVIGLGANTYNTSMWATIDAFHPYKTVAQANTGNQYRLVNTYGNNISLLQEVWRDEYYRLPASFDTDTIPASITGQWDSSIALGDHDALVYNQALQYGKLDFTPNLPSGSPNYSAKAGDQIYMRAFNIGVSKPNMSLTLPNITSADIGANLSVEIKLPGQTGWCNINADIDANTFDKNPVQPKDGQGCRISVTGNTWQISFGGKNTTQTNGIVFVRITFRNTSAKAITSTIVAA